MEQEKEIKITTLGMNCPKPLIETRKMLNKMEPGQILIVEGDHQISRQEIPQAIQDTNDEVIKIDDHEEKWYIYIKKR